MTVTERQTLPDMTPTQALHALLRIGFDVAMIASGGMLVATLAAFLLERSSLGVLAAVAAVFTGLVAMRINTARQQLGAGELQR